MKDTAAIVCETEDGTLLYGAAARAAFDQELDETRAALDSLSPEQNSAREQYYRRRRDTVCRNAVARRGAQTPKATPRPREARRAKTLKGAARRSSDRSGSSGDDDSDDHHLEDPDEPPPPATGRRFCACGCGWSIDHLRADAAYLNSTHRKRGFDNRARGGEKPPVKDGDAYLDLPAHELEALLNRGGCRCNGGPTSRHGYRKDETYILGGDGSCVKCGRDRIIGIAPYYALLWERERLRSYLRARSPERGHERPCEVVS